MSDRTAGAGSHLRIRRTAGLAVGCAVSVAYLALIFLVAARTAQHVNSASLSGDGLELLYLDVLAVPWSFLLPFIVHSPPVSESGYVAVLTVACLANWLLLNVWVRRRLRAGSWAPAGWYTDHAGGDQLRYWDGTGWTGSVRPARQQRFGYDAPVFGDPLLWAAMTGATASLVLEILSAQGVLWALLWALPAAGAWLILGACAGALRQAIRDARTTPL